MMKYTPLLCAGVLQPALVSSQAVMIHAAKVVYLQAVMANACSHGLWREKPTAQACVPTNLGRKNTSAGLVALKTAKVFH
jgi:hypothetical protein